MSKVKWAFKNFEPEEFICKCYERCSHKHIHVLHGRIPEMAQRRRDELGKPLTITSALRCPAWNSHPSIGGIRQSFHIKGLAFDISFEGIDPVQEARHWAHGMGHRGGLIAYPEQGFVHIDLGPGRSDNGVRHFVMEGGMMHRVKLADAANV